MPSPSSAFLLNSHRSWTIRTFSTDRRPLAFNGFFLISAVTILSAGSGFSKWVGYVGVFAALIGLVAMFRNVTPQVALIAEVNNYLLPIWMIIFGVALTRRGRSYLEEEP